MKAADEGTRRYFFTPGDGGDAWVLVEALRMHEGWEVRQAAKLGMRILPDVPPPGADWVEARPPTRKPRLPKPAAGPTKRAPETKDGGKPTQERPPGSPRPRAPARTPATPVVPAKAPSAKPARPAVPPERLPSLAQELGALLAAEQKRQKAPEGMVKCPTCGLALQPTKNKRVRTHDDPLKGSRCEASNRPWAEFV